jgi:diadenosine tetraphosphate (Ap4A) HIT family hydrolase
MSEKNCLFCSEKISREVAFELGTVFAVADSYPVTRGHMLIIPKRHVVDYFSMSDAEKRDSEKLIKLIRERIVEDDKTVEGFNIGLNCGRVAGQTVLHAHIHLIPRRKGDTEDPRGGVRGVIPEKQRY